MIREIQTQPFDDQKPGTSGLRKRALVFEQTNYAENFIQSIFACAGTGEGKPLIVGGDGRYLNREVIGKVLAIAAGNGVTHVMLGQGGILSTPAASNLIRKYGAFGGIILSASHNPGGPEGDFGIKFNSANGGPANERLTGEIFEYSKSITTYRKAEIDLPDIDRTGSYDLAGMRLEIIDPVADYAELMEEIFDFGAIRSLFSSGFSFVFDAMHAVTGPYALEIFANRLGVDPKAIRNAIPKEDFGGGHPDPNLIHARWLAEVMFDADAPDLGAASDGDGDRNLILGKGMFVNPSDSLAILAANAYLAPRYRGGIAGIARSMPTSAAADRVAEGLGVPLYETPTGWKFFGNLLDEGRVTICGEESAGTGSDHVREKDGLWAILLWLNILAERRVSVQQIVADHWNRFGRNFYARHDFEGLEAEQAQALLIALQGSLPELRGRSIGGLVVTGAESFSYHDPVDGSVSENQGIIVRIDGDRRIVYRLSGTGTSGATLRMYLDRWENDALLFNEEPGAALAELALAGAEIAQIEKHTGRTVPSVIT